MTDLKPCPFCGGTKIGWKWIAAYSLDSSYAIFGCNECDACFPADENNKAHPDDIAAWNRRATPPEVQALIEALQFYADKAAWTQPPVRVLDGEFGPAYENEASKMQRDMGEIARAALAKWLETNGA